MVAQSVSVDEHADVLAALSRGVPAWMKDATCAEYADRADWWFPEGSAVGPKALYARAVCQRCVRQSDCLAFALEQGRLLRGIWGGASQQERKVLVRRGVTADLVRRFGPHVDQGREVVADEAACGWADLTSMTTTDALAVATLTSWRRVLSCAHGEDTGKESSPKALRAEC